MANTVYRVLMGNNCHGFVDTCYQGDSGNFFDNCIEENFYEAMSNIHQSYYNVPSWSEYNAEGKRIRTARVAINANHVTIMGRR
eukprot:6317955-Amphidinium_carterae.1